MAWLMGVVLLHDAKYQPNGRGRAAGQVLRNSSFARARAGLDPNRASRLGHWRAARPRRDSFDVPFALVDSLLGVCVLGRSLATSSTNTSSTSGSQSRSPLD